MDGVRRSRKFLKEEPLILRLKDREEEEVKRGMRRRIALKIISRSMMLRRRSLRPKIVTLGLLGTLF